MMETIGPSTMCAYRINIWVGPSYPVYRVHVRTMESRQDYEWYFESPDHSDAVIIKIGESVYRFHVSSAIEQIVESYMKEKSKK